jgi:hypothetical protein
MKLRFATLLALVPSCAAPAPRPRPQGVPIAPAPSLAATSETPDAARATAEPVARIEPAGVGDIRIGSPIPARHLADEADARRRYEIRWVADAQPFEAFRIDDPPVIAVIDDGPFETWAKDNVGPLEPGRFADEAIAFAKAGAPVAWIVIEQKGPVTSTGIGVGSSWDDVLAGHPSAKVLRDPEWFSSKPTCRVQLPELAGVTVLLARCAGENGDVERVLITR